MSNHSCYKSLVLLYLPQSLLFSVEIQAPSNGGRTITSQSVGGRVTYYCNGGYRLVGSQTRNCVGDGRGGASWSGSLPTCEGVCDMSV